MGIILSTFERSKSFGRTFLEVGLVVDEHKHKATVRIYKDKFRISLGLNLVNSHNHFES